MARSLISPSTISFNLPFCGTSSLKVSRKFTIQSQPSSSRLHSEHFWERNIKFLSSKPSKPGRKNSGSLLCRAGKIYKVEIEHEGKTQTLQVEEDETILSKALDAGINVPHDCKLGVCMTCPAKLVSGEVEQSEGMLSDDVVEKGLVAENHRWLLNLFWYQSNKYASKRIAVWLVKKHTWMSTACRVNVDKSFTEESRTLRGDQTLAHPKRKK